MAVIEWLPEAKADLERLHAFIQPKSADAARRAVLTIIEGVERLADFPELGAPWEPDMDYRELIIPFGARAYVARYRLLGDRVIIVRIWHGLEKRA